MKVGGLCVAILLALIQCEKCSFSRGVWRHAPKQKFETKCYENESGGNSVMKY